MSLYIYAIWNYMHNQQSMINMSHIVYVFWCGVTYRNKISDTNIYIQPIFQCNYTMAEQ